MPPKIQEALKYTTGIHINNYCLIASTNWNVGQIFKPHTLRLSVCMQMLSQTMCVDGVFFILSLYLPVSYCITSHAAYRLNLLPTRVKMCTMQQNMNAMFPSFTLLIYKRDKAFLYQSNYILQRQLLS